MSSRTDQPTAPQPTSQGSAAAFFDLDKTIIARSSAYAFNRQLFQRGVITPATLLNLAYNHAVFMSHGHDDDQMNAASSQLSALVAGHDPEELRELAKESMATSITPYIYAEAAELISWHRSQGHKVYIVSASASQVVEPIAEALGVDDVVASELEVCDGLFTGEIRFFCRGLNKALQLQRIAAREGHDLQASYAYSDSVTDEPMLAEVGHPMAVNPDRGLAEIAAARGWPIRHFKKPVPLISDRIKQTTVVTAAVGTLAVGLGAGIAAALRNKDR